MSIRRDSALESELAVLETDGARQAAKCVRARPERNPYLSLNGHRKHGEPVIIGVISDQVYPPGRAHHPDLARRPEAFPKPVSKFCRFCGHYYTVKEE